MAYYRLSIDNQSSQYVVQANQYDMHKYVTFEIVESLKNKLVRVEIETKQGSCVEVKATVSNDHLVNFNIDPQITYKAGTYRANIVTYDSGKINRVSYPTFKIKVNPTANPNADMEALTPLAVVIEDSKKATSDATETNNTVKKDFEKFKKDWNQWLGNITDVLDANAETKLYMMLKAMTADTEIASIEHNLNKHVHVSIVKYEWGAGLGGAGQTPCGGTESISIPSDYTLVDINNIKVRTIAGLGTVDEVRKVDNNTYCLNMLDNNTCLTISLNVNGA